MVYKYIMKYLIILFVCMNVFIYVVFSNKINYRVRRPLSTTVKITINNILNNV